MGNKTHVFNFATNVMTILMEDQKQTSEVETAPQASTSPTNDIKAINEKIQQHSSFVDLLSMEMDKVIVGQKYMVERL